MSSQASVSPAQPIFAHFTTAQKLILLFLLGMILFIPTSQPLHAQESRSQEICPAVGIQEMNRGYPAGGIILTAFDRTALWVYDVATGRRYPLPETAPCGSNCHLSPDFTEITYFNYLIRTYNRMRLNGTGRALVAESASEVEWWGENTFLIWTPGQMAYLRDAAGTERDHLNVQSVVSVQPNGTYGVLIQPNEDREGFHRELLDLRTRNTHGVNESIVLGADIPYFNNQSWSPDGQFLAYIVATLNADDDVVGNELYGYSARDGETRPWTQLTDTYGVTRINGLSPDRLSWSPDSTRIAYWVTELTGSDPTANTGVAMIHILDVVSGDHTIYCGFVTTQHTPNPPRLVWSPDGNHLAFAGDVETDERAVLLLALDTETGIFTALSEGVASAMGGPNVVAWGILE